MAARSPGFSMAGPEAVSYTHLDVYKRQPYVPLDLVFSPTLASWEFSSRFISQLLLSALRRLVLHLGRTMISFPLLESLTWIASPATGIDFQPQTQDHFIIKKPLRTVKRPKNKETGTFKLHLF